MVSAAMAGAAGALYAHYVRIVDPDVFLFIYTVTMVIMVVTGGKGTLAGPIVGGLIFGLLPEVPARGSPIRPEVQWIDLRRADDPGRLFPAARASCRLCALVAAPRERRRGCRRRRPPPRPRDERQPPPSSRSRGCRSASAASPPSTTSPSRCARARCSR